MKINTFILGVFLLLPNISFAQSHVGNGGDVVVCRNTANEITSIELLDFYEAKDLRQISYDLGEPSLSIDEKILLAIHRLSRLDPDRAETYLKKAQLFMEQAHFAHNKELPDISDSGHLVFPAGCKVEQIVISDVRRYFPEDKLWLPDGKSYIVNGDLWSNPLFNNDQKAGLILHEVIYWELRKAFEHSSSIWARYFNSYITSSQLEGFNIENYVTLLSRAQIHSFKYGNLFIEPNNCNFYNTGNVKLASLREGQHNVLRLLGKEVILKSDGKIEFYNSRQIKHAYLINHDSFILATPERKLVNAEEIWLEENGKIKEIAFRQDYYWEKNSKTITLLVDEELSQKVNDILNALLSIRTDPYGRSQISMIHFDLHLRDYTENLDQFLLFGEALLSLSEGEREILRRRLEHVSIEQAYGRVEITNLLGYEIAHTELQKLKQEPNDHPFCDPSNLEPFNYFLNIFFDNNKGEKELVTKEHILKEFQKIIRGQ